MFDEEAGVFDDEEAGGTGFFGGGGVGDSLLEPEDSGADSDGGIGDGRDFIGAAEDVDDVNRIGDVFEAGIGFFAQDFGFVGIDRDDAVAGGLEIGGDFVRGAAGIGGESNDGDVFVDAEELGDGVGSGGDEVWKVEEHECSSYFIDAREERK